MDSKSFMSLFKVSSQLLRSNRCLFYPQESITQVEIDHDGQAKNGNGKKWWATRLSGTQIQFFGGHFFIFDSGPMFLNGGEKDAVWFVVELF